MGVSGGRRRRAGRRLPFPRACIRQRACRVSSDRGRSSDRRSDYHDAILPPRHALLAFGLWLRHVAKADALVHMGAHGTLEWLPGKAVALTGSCFPEAGRGRAAGDLSLHRQQPRRSGAGQAPDRGGDHRPSAAAARRGGLSGEARELERLVDEYAQADGLDRRRRERLARLILRAARADRTGGRSRRAARRRSRRRVAPDRRLAVRPQGSRDQGRAPCLWARARRPSTTLRGRRAPRRARGCSSPPRRSSGCAGPGRLAGARTSRRAADRAQPVRRRSAHAADADGDRARPARGRRSDPHLHASAWRDAARARSSTSGAAQPCAPAAKRSRRAWR